MISKYKAMTTKQLNKQVDYLNKTFKSYGFNVVAQKEKDNTILALLTEEAKLYETHSEERSYILKVFTTWTKNTMKHYLNKLEMTLTILQKG